MRTWVVPVALALMGGAIIVQIVDGGRQRSELEALRASVSAPTRAGEVNRERSAPRRDPPPREDAAPGQAPAQAADARSPSPAAPDAEGPGEGAAEKPAAPPMEPEEVRFRLDTVFHDESVDRAWTAGAQATAQRRLSAVLPETSRLRSIECRASLCRVESAHQDPDSYNRFVYGAFHDPATKLWNGGSFATVLPDPDEEGRVVTVAYLARDGHSLPPVWQDE
ncbi:hypothetical protein AB3662_26660 [Sorangium cellulosum]|uniref:hypothetical protein n=1 Tax=Sorangium cellulosum TaxID=56 RepID=UPI003D9A7A21